MKTPSARAAQPANDNGTPLPETPEAKVRLWGMVYENFEDGPGGGFVLREVVLPIATVEAATVRSWPPELLSVVIPRMAGRAQAFAADGDSAEGGTY